MHCVAIGHDLLLPSTVPFAILCERPRRLQVVTVASAVVYAGESEPSVVCESNPCIIPVKNRVD